MFGTGKNVPLIAMAHRIPYVATASVANLRDLEQKVTTAMEIHGARYIHIHVPCPLGWGSAPADTIRLARLAVESGLFPLFEARDGKVTARTPIRRKVPVDEYLKLQKRFAHLFGNAAGAERIALIQAMADRNIAEFGLLAEDATPWISRSRSRSTSARASPTRPGRGAPTARSTSTGCRRATTRARRARTSRAGCSTPSPATTRPRGAR